MRWPEGIVMIPVVTFLFGMAISIGQGLVVLILQRRDPPPRLWAGRALAVQVGATFGALVAAVCLVPEGHEVSAIAVLWLGGLLVLVFGLVVLVLKGLAGTVRNRGRRRVWVGALSVVCLLALTTVVGTIYYAAVGFEVYVLNEQFIRTCGEVKDGQRAFFNTGGRTNPSRYADRLEELLPFVPSLAVESAITFRFGPNSQSGYTLTLWNADLGRPCKLSEPPPPWRW